MKKEIAIKLLLPIALLVVQTVSAQGVKSPNVMLGKSPIADVVKAMSLEEKVKLLVGNGFRFQGGPDANENRPPEKVPGAAGNTYAIPQLGIPSIVLSDGPAGIRINPIRNNDSTRTYYATAFPVATLLASTWDTTLVSQVGKAFGSEAHEYGVDILLAPAMNIHRNPLGGRNFEYYSEDPLVSGSIAAAFVNGFQSNGVGTSIKHFVANNQETDRNSVNTIVSERALREIYLKGFEIAVKRSQPWTVMSSYNYVNGKYTSENFDLLTTILRDEWGFKGLVMTDWFGGSDPVAQMKAGNDLLMPGRPQQAMSIMSAIKHDSLDVKVIDTNVERMLALIVKSSSFHRYRYSDKPDLKANATISRAAATDGMVLLKNKDALPVNPSKKIALFGVTAYDFIAGGTGSGDVHKAYVVSLADGLANSGYVLDNGLKESYETYITEEKAKQPKPRNFFEHVPPIGEMELAKDIADQQATTADVGVYVLGRISGEGRDREVQNDFYLTDAEKSVIDLLSNSFHQHGKKLVVILNTGGVVDVASWRDKADAILLAYQPGLEGGNAVADIFSGKVSPSGKLATTFPVNYTDVPSSKNFPGKEFPEKAKANSFGRPHVPAEVVYEEGIYVGYRYYNTFDVKPAYAFGYGLSYTNFTYSNAKVAASAATGRVSVSVEVKNSGQVAGREVVEVYVSAPGKTISKPSIELRAFAKTKSLQPGQSQVLSFVIDEKDLASFETQRSAWITEPGSYMVKIGASAGDIRQTGAFNISKEIVAEQVHHVLVPEVNLNEMTK